MNALVIGGCVLLIIALVLAWLLVFVRILSVKSLKRLFPSSDDLIKAHIDYILMSLLLFAFYALGEELPAWMVGAMLLGATINPLLFIVIAMKGEPATKPGPVFTGIAVLSFVAATVGFGGAAIIVALSHL